MKIEYTYTSYDAQKPRKIDNFFDFIEMLVLTFFVVIVVTCFGFRHSVVEGGSMEETLFDGEHLLISSVYKPEAGDIVVFYSDTLKKPLVKRVIATEGQTVTVKSDTEVFVDGIPVDSSFAYTNGASPYKNDYPMTFTVPEGCVFVLGDHRNDSRDSRELGAIPVEFIYGKVLLRIAPLDSFGKVD